MGNFGLNFLPSLAALAQDPPGTTQFSGAVPNAVFATQFDPLTGQPLNAPNVTNSNERPNVVSALQQQALERFQQENAPFDPQGNIFFQNAFQPAGVGPGGGVNIPVPAGVFRGPASGGEGGPGGTGIGSLLAEIQSLQQFAPTQRDFGAELPQAPTVPLPQGLSEEDRTAVLQALQANAPGNFDDAGRRQQEMLGFLQGMAGGALQGGSVGGALAGIGAGGLGGLGQQRDITAQDLAQHQANVEQNTLQVAQAQREAAMLQQQEQAALAAADFQQQQLDAARTAEVLQQTIGQEGAQSRFGLDLGKLQLGLREGQVRRQQGIEDRTAAENRAFLAPKISGGNVIQGTVDPTGERSLQVTPLQQPGGQGSNFVNSLLASEKLSKTPLGSQVANQMILSEGLRSPDASTRTNTFIQLGLLPKAPQLLGAKEMQRINKEVDEAMNLIGITDSEQKQVQRNSAYADAIARLLQAGGVDWLNTIRGKHPGLSNIIDQFKLASGVR